MAQRNNPGYIESDRRSAVSSFYGGRTQGRSSFDILNNNNEAGMQSQRQQGRDDASSFYGSQRGPRGSTDLLVNQTAGYNRRSYFDVGREAPVKGGDEDAAFLGQQRGGRDEEAGWDVFADFNNAGPRYSSAFVKYAEEYQDLPPPGTPPQPMHTPTKLEETTSNSGAPVELVTVPALGAEWKKSELEAMTKKGRRKIKSGDKDRWGDFRSWTRDQRGCCGRYGTRKQVVIVAFIVCVIIAVIIAFTIPRVPAITFTSNSPLSNTTGPPATIFSRAPANFSFAANVALKVDTSGNFLPLRLNKIDATVLDLDSNFQIGQGNTSMTVPAKAFTDIQLPLNFTYVAPNDSDVTWINWYNGCRNHALNQNGTRPGVNFRLELDLHIAGLIGSRAITMQINNADCPIELPQNSV